MPFKARFVFEITQIPARTPQEAAEKALLEVAKRLKIRPLKKDIFRVFIGQAEIGRVEKEP